MLELFRKYRTPLLAGCLVLVALLLFSVNLRKRPRTTLFEKAILQITAPLQMGIDSACEFVADTWSHYLWLVETSRRNETLLMENRLMRQELDTLEEVRLANERLRSLLDFKEEVALPALPAQVIAEDSSSWFRTVVIDKGSEDGVREGLPVVVPEGAVGRVIKCAPRQARVLLVTDASSSVATLVQRNRTRGICRGQGDVLALEFALRQEDIAVGDPVITSGTGGVFPKGLTLGRVSGVDREGYGLFQTVTVIPAVDFSRLEEVLVLLREER